MLEIACFEMTSAETALQSVADRIEFCANIELGGTTPNIDEFRYLKSKYLKPIFVMIRPVGGDFLYSDAEFILMQQSITEFRAAGADGFVFGILEAGNRIDSARCAQLLELAAGIPCTFHRAFDRTPDLEQAAETLIELGFRAVLTSGGKPTAMEGRHELRKLVDRFSERLDILIGGGVRSGNIADLKRETKGKFFHSSAIPAYEYFCNADEIKNLILNL